MKGTMHCRPAVMAAVISAAVMALPPASTAFRGGQLFIQVHITSQLSGISSAELRGILSGETTRYDEIGGDRRPMRIFADPRIAEGLRKLHPRLDCTVRSFDDERVMSDRGFLGISDARGLMPCFKPLYVDGSLPWGRIGEDGSLSDADGYPFVMRGAEIWHQDSHLTLVQTGTTAMTRAFIPAVDRAGDLLSPIRHTMAITSGADLAATSNEVSFTDPCAYPLRDRMTFCSPLRFFRILIDSGFDVIELTGNHNNDFGRAHGAETIAMIEKAGMTYYGGGRNRADAERVRFVRVKGAVVAFVGFNEQGPGYAFASETGAGAARLARELFVRLVSEAVSKADIVVVTVQWANENDPVPHAVQKRYFRLAAELGADIMVSSSSHRPMGLEFHRGRFISYGLGNFLFDQMQSLNHRRGLIARHHVYKGKHVSTELIPYLIHNYSQPRILRGRDARLLMDEVFRWSGGPPFR